MQVTPGGNASSQTNSCCKSSNSLPYTPLHTGIWLGINAVEWTMRVMPCLLQVIRTARPPPPPPNQPPKKILSSLPHTPLHAGRWLGINAVEWAMQVKPGGNASHQTNPCALQVIRPKVKVSSSVPHTPITPHRKMTGNKCSGMSHAGHARWKCKSPNKLLCIARHQTKSKSHPLFLTHTSLPLWE